MGLDMYLSARKYVSKMDWSGDKPTTKPEFNTLLTLAKLDKVATDGIYGASVSVNVAYWRKANQIHNWFVTFVQNGVDECQEAHVTHEQIKDLLATCEEALQKKDPSSLMPQGGFFFGSTDIDDFYWGDIEDTIKQLRRIINLPEFEELSFTYQSSW